MSFAHHSRIAVAALLSSLFTTPVAASCPDDQDEQCDPLNIKCVCVPRIGGNPIPIPGATPPGSPVPVSPIPLPEPIPAEVDKLGKDASNGQGRPLAGLGRSPRGGF